MVLALIGVGGVGGAGRKGNTDRSKAFAPPRRSQLMAAALVFSALLASLLLQAAWSGRGVGGDGSDGNDGSDGGEEALLRMAAEALGSAAAGLNASQAFDVDVAHRRLYLGSSAWRR